MDEATRELRYEKAPDSTYRDVCRALAAMGHVKSSDDATRTVKGTARPLPSNPAVVGLEAKVEHISNGSVVRISAVSDDIKFSGQARAAIDQLAAEISG